MSLNEYTSIQLTFKNCFLLKLAEMMKMAQISEISIFPKLALTLIFTLPSYFQHTESAAVILIQADNYIVF